MSFDLKNKIKLGGYCDKPQKENMFGMLGAPTEIMDIIHYVIILSSNKITIYIDLCKHFARRDEEADQNGHFH